MKGFQKEYKAIIGLDIALELIINTLGTAVPNLRIDSKLGMEAFWVVYYDQIPVPVTARFLKHGIFNNMGCLITWLFRSCSPSR